MTPDELHELVHRDAVAAWPHIAALIDRGGDRSGGGGAWDVSTLLEDLIYSVQLPQLIDAIELKATQSRPFREALLWSSSALGGKGGPEMDRIFKLVADAEAELATVVQFEDEADLRTLQRALPMSQGGKAIIFQRRAGTAEKDA